jgi:hypothetical protein
MCIEKFGDNTRHSAWNSKREALHQSEVLTPSWSEGLSGLMIALSNLVEVRFRVIRQSLEQQSLRKEWLLFGLVVWFRTIDTEDVPSFARIGWACFGDTCGWVSRFAPFDSHGIVRRWQAASGTANVEHSELKGGQDAACV